MKSSLATTPLVQSSKDSFSEFIWEVQNKYITYRNTLLIHQKSLKLLQSKYKQLILKTEFLTSHLQESIQSCQTLKFRLKTLTPDLFNNINQNSRLDFFRLLPVRAPQKDFESFLSLLEHFEYLEIPDRVLSAKACDTFNYEKSTCVLGLFLNLSVDCKMKHDLLNCYNIEILGVLHEIEELKGKIELIEEKLEDFTSKIEIFDGNSKVETQEHEFILDSDELYGMNEGIGDTSTIIFEGKPFCSVECCEIF